MVFWNVKGKLVCAAWNARPLTADDLQDYDITLGPAWEPWNPRLSTQPTNRQSWARCFCEPAPQRIPLLLGYSGALKVIRYTILPGLIGISIAETRDTYEPTCISGMGCGNFVSSTL